MKFEYPSGATSLNPDEIDGLKPMHITTQGQLNEWESANILKAETWAFGTSHHENFLTIGFIKLLHKKMFNDTWRWAGSFRNSDKNIGVEYFKIEAALTDLLQDVICQIQKNSYEMDEIAMRFHHRLVWIHPFPNGNGRHARLITDIFLREAGRPLFSWGEHQSKNKEIIRSEYINALRCADKHDYQALKRFVRS